MSAIAKTVTYGIMHIIIAFLVALLVSGDLHVAIGISLLEPFVQILFFSIHEYFWTRSHPGVPSPHQGCCSNFSALSKLKTLFFQK